MTRKRTTTFNSKTILFIILPVVITVLLLALTFFLLAIPYLERNIILVKREMIRELTDTAHQTLVYYEDKVQKGELSLADAQYHAKEYIRTVRYGPEQKDYFWINDMRPFMIMHPYRTDLEGGDLSDYADPDGKLLFVEFVKTVRRHGAGYVDYRWQWQDIGDEIIPKISYVKGFDPWGWIIGTGIYLRDVDASVAGIIRNSIAVFTVIMGVISGLLFFIIWRSGILERERQEALESLQSAQKERGELFNNAFEFIAKLDGEGILLKANRTALDFIGLENEEEVENQFFWNTPWWSPFPELQELLKKKILQASRGEAVRFEGIHRGVGGKVLQLDISLKPVKDENGEVLYLIAEGRDITERKHLEEELRESVIRFRGFAEATQYGFGMSELNGTIIYQNQTLCRMLGEEPPEGAVGHQLFSYYSPEMVKKLEKEVMPTLKKVGHWRGELELQSKDGRHIPVLENYFFLYDEKGVPYSMADILTDITELKAAEQALRESEERIHLITNNLTSVIVYQYITRADGTYNYSFISDNVKNIIQVEPGKVLEDPLTLFHMIPEKKRRLMEDVSHKTHDSFTDFIFETEMTLPDGEIRWFQYRSSPHVLPNGDTAWDGVIIDISDEKKTEMYRQNLNRISELLIKSGDPEVMFRNVAEALLEIFNCDRAWALYAVNPAEDTFQVPIIQTAPGWFVSEGITVPIDTEVSQSMHSVFASDDPIVSYCSKEPRLPGMIIKEFQAKSQMAVTINPNIGNGWILGLHQCSYERDWSGLDLQFFREIADRIKDRLNTLLFSRELEKTKNYVSNIIDSMPSILIGVDPEGIITQWNKTAEQTTGLSGDKAVGTPLDKAIPRLSGEMERVRRSIKEGRDETDPRRVYVKNGETFYEDVTVYPLVSGGEEGAVIRMDDVTQQVLLEEMMVQSEKMLSVGGLAAGMAHEINNPLAGMMQTAHVMGERLSNVKMPANLRAAETAGTTMETISGYMHSRGILSMVQAIIDSGRRAAEIVQNMLSFARKESSSFSSHDPVELIDRILELASTDYNLKKQYDFKTIEIIKEYEDNLPLIQCEGAKIQQVILNILRNGAEAMNEYQTRCKARGEEAPLPRFILRLSLEQKAGRLRFEIEDNGPGMDEATRKRIFEPFYTTKPVGIGTGLGLSVSYFIITKIHGGTMTVESEPGKGSIFIISLPVEREQP